MKGLVGVDVPGCELVFGAKDSAVISAGLTCCLGFLLGRLHRSSHPGGRLRIHDRFGETTPTSIRELRLKVWWVNLIPSLMDRSVNLLDTNTAPVGCFFALH